ncbi:hypothetical protein BGZ83_007462 [Gryganskiella cystojenkinii]|nr:hypothetical protein BGZ83_007462 [Gryganskiella cystojenkinii]
MRLFTVTLHLVTLAALAFCSVAAADLAQQKPRTHPSLKTLESYPWKTLAVGPYPNSSYKPRFAAAVQHLDKRHMDATAAVTAADVLLVTHTSVEPTAASTDATVPPADVLLYGCNGDTCGCPSDSYMCSDMSGCCKTGYTCTPGTDLCAPPTSSPPPNPSPNGPGPINTNDPNNQDSKHSGLSTPAIIGISVGAVAAVGLAAAMFALKAKSAAAKAAHLAKHAGAANGHQLDPMNHGGHPNHDIIIMEDITAHHRVKIHPLWDKRIKIHPLWDKDNCNKVNQVCHLWDKVNKVYPLWDKRTKDN